MHSWSDVMLKHDQQCGHACKCLIAHEVNSATERAYTYPAVALEKVDAAIAFSLEQAECTFETDLLQNSSIVSSCFI